MLYETEVILPAEITEFFDAIRAYSGAQVNLSANSVSLMSEAEDDYELANLVRDTEREVESLGFSLDIPKPAKIES